MYGRKVKSVIYSLNRNEFQKLVSSSNSISDIIKFFKLDVSSGNYRTIKKRFIEEKIDYSHIRLGKGFNKGRKFPGTGKKLELILIENSFYNNKTLKKRLIENGLLKNECYICHLQPMWNEQPLSLQIDHINGDHFDNRIENLRILCPNCHTQTATYGSKNKTIKQKQFNKCERCGTKITDYATKCVNCIEHPTKINWPSNDELINLLEKSSYVSVGKMLGVSDNAVRKRLKRVAGA